VLAIGDRLATVTYDQSPLDSASKMASVAVLELERS